MKSNMVIAAIMLLGALCPVALAEQPDNYTLEYYIRQTPSDPESRLIYTVNVKLELYSPYQSQITTPWEVIEVEITQHDLAGFPPNDITWVDDSPTVDTGDGLWWVAHEDAEDPQPEEFNVVPLLSGTADNSDPSGTDLEYSFEGDSYSGSPQYGGRVTAATYEFTLVGEEEPEAEGEDEPTEIEGFEDPE